MWQKTVHISEAQMNKYMQNVTEYIYSYLYPTKLLHQNVTINDCRLLRGCLACKIFFSPMKLCQINNTFCGLIKSKISFRMSGDSISVFKRREGAASISRKHPSIKLKCNSISVA